MTPNQLPALIQLVESRTGLTVHHVLCSQVPKRNKLTGERYSVSISMHFMLSNNVELGYWYTFYGDNVVLNEVPYQWTDEQVKQHKRIEL